MLRYRMLGQIIEARMSRKTDNTDLWEKLLEAPSDEYNSKKARKLSDLDAMKTLYEYFNRSPVKTEEDIRSTNRFTPTSYYPPYRTNVDGYVRGPDNYESAAGMEYFDSIRDRFGRKPDPIEGLIRE